MGKIKTMGGVEPCVCATMNGEPWKADGLGLLLLTLLVGAIDVTGWGFQPILSQSDHGRELYFALQVWKGKTPYVDFDWYYGPLMLYYHAGLFSIFGVSIGTVKIGWTMLYTILILVMYVGSRQILKPLYALGAALALAVIYPVWFHNYNHIGVTLACTASVGLLPQLLVEKPHWRWLAVGALIVIAALVKINVALSFAAAVGLSLTITRIVRWKEWPALLLWGFSCLAAIVALYACWIARAPLEHFSRWFIFSSHRLLILQESLWQKIFVVFFEGTLTDLLEPAIWPFTLVPLFSAGVFLAGLIYLLRRCWQRKWDSQTWIALYFVLAIFLNAHEFWIIGTTYALLFFSWPFVCVLGFWLLQNTTARKNDPAGCSVAVATPILLFTLLGIYLCSWQVMTKKYEIELPRAQISVSNASWAQVVTQTTKFMAQRLGPGEPIFAIPCDQIYYFLTDGRLPTREDAYYALNYVTPAEEEQVIADLQKHEVRWIILSNQCLMPPHLGGGFGQSGCQRLAHYIFQNYHCVATFGPWDRIPRWIQSHAVKIYQKNPEIP